MAVPRVALRRAGLLAGLGLALAACTSPIPEPMPAAEETPDADWTVCASIVSGFVDDVQGYIDGVAALSASELAEAPAADVALASAARRHSTLLASASCDDDERVGALIAGELERLRVDGAVAELVRTSVTAAVLGQAVEHPDELAVSVSDDLAAVAAVAPAGTTLRLEAGEHSTADVIVVRDALAIVGAGTDDTTVASSAEGAALLAVGAGPLRLSQLTLAHVGDAAATVVVVQSDAYHLRHVRLTGGAADDDGAGGAGLVVGADEHGPADAAAAGGRAMRVDDSAFEANEGGGLVVTGFDAPRITRSTFAGNGGCGICYTGMDGGALTTSEATANDFGVVVASASRPRILGNTIADNDRVGILLENHAAATIRGNVITGNGELGVLIADDAAPDLVANEMRDHAESGVAASGSATGTLADNDLRGNAVGFWVEDDAAPSITGNHIAGADTVGLIFRDRAGGVVERNACADGAEGVVLLDASAPELADNVCALHDER